MLPIPKNALWHSDSVSQLRIPQHPLWVVAQTKALCKAINSCIPITDRLLKHVCHFLKALHRVLIIPRRVEVKDIDLPHEMKRAMAKQAEAERERRGKVIAAAGEAQAAAKLAEAAEIIQHYPVAIQLRFLQTVVEIAAENNSTTVFPIPMDLFQPIQEAGERWRAGEKPSLKALEAASEGMALPEGTDQAMLAEAAKAFLGLGSGGKASEATSSEGDTGETDES